MSQTDPQHPARPDASLPTPTGDAAAVAAPLVPAVPSAPFGAWHEPTSVTGPTPVLTGTGAHPEEQVGRGLLVALAAILAAGGLSVLVWNLGYVASITSFALAAGATYGYTWAAGSAPRRGVVPLVALILLGIVATFLSFVGWDASQYFDSDPAVAAAGYTRSDFVMSAMTDGEVVGEYAGDLAMYFVFAALGTFGTLRMLFARRP